MNLLQNKNFTGERALFQGHDLWIKNSSFFDGESPLKESRNIKIENCAFQWKYPFWYSKDIDITNSILDVDARAAMWYTDSISIKDTTIEAPKSLRRTQNIHLDHVHFSNAEETLWNCRNVHMDHVTASGSYFAMGCEDMDIDHLSITGGYSFDGVKNVRIRNSRLASKDAFWNSENVVVENSLILGEYVGWNSKNITFINCVIESNQGFCYMENVKLINCTLNHTVLAFEYSTVDADIRGRVESVKNPVSGRIVAEHIDEIIFDNQDVEQGNTVITYHENQL